jgi:hypothetical protein
MSDRRRRDKLGLLSIVVRAAWPLITVVILIQYSSDAINFDALLWRLELRGDGKWPGP